MVFIKLHLSLKIKNLATRSKQIRVKEMELLHMKDQKWK